MEDRAAQDQRLVRAALEGDGGAFGQLVAAYQRMVGGVAWRYGVAREDVEDAVSEVFVKAWQNLQRYEPDHPFSTWLYRVAANHVIDRGRRQRHERARVEMPAALADSAPDASSEMESRERIELVRAALAELPEHYRSVLFLVYVEGLRVEDAARVLGLPSGTIKTRLMRGRAALRDRLTCRHPELG